MYAKSSPADAYHLLTEAGSTTLCGLSVVPIVIDRPVKTSGLHLTSKEPDDLTLCEDCARIRTAKQEKGE
jgi:hypothetical protein